MILSTIYILISSVLGYRLQRVCLQITPVLNLESCICGRPLRFLYAFNPIVRLTRREKQLHICFESISTCRGRR
ncbi:hypothetical protein IWW34DRAFT_404659 [Fusarium oxysporum f. sp. albedinis]|nr:hypothetical protein IWW34DRAFT_404659 [Fusarium oxysporum f. sp. albedinis]